MLVWAKAVLIQKPALEPAVWLLLSRSASHFQSPVADPGRVPVMALIW